MLGHLGINVPDLDVVRSYHGELLPMLAFEVFLDEEDQIAYRPAGGKPGTYLFFYRAPETSTYSRKQPGLQHLAFMVPTRATVTEVYDAALRLGGAPVREPQEWPQYPPPYFAGFWTDPFGFMLEAVCHHDR